jgi:uncharacterized protein (DUF885 family)
MSPITRRSLLGGAVAMLMSTTDDSAARPDADARLRSILDTAKDDPAAGLAALRAIDPDGLSRSARIDRDTALAGLTIDAELERRFGGAAFAGDPDHYALLLRRRTGDDADPSLLERRLNVELAATITRADRRFAEIGHREGSIGGRFSALWRDPRWHYPDDDRGRDQAVADMSATLDTARRGLGRMFAALPPEVLDVDVRWTRQNGYREVPQPGRRGGYFVDLDDIRRRPSWTLPAVVHHELLPGHMVQLPIEARADPHPLRLTYAPAFAEGWAIHAEQLAAASGAYADRPLADLGHCHWLLFRITRGLADLGMHLNGWTRSDTLDRLRGWMGEPVYFAPFAADLDRIGQEPASRAAEALVWLTLADLARGRDLRAYHQAVLVDGRKRTDLLRTMVEAAA